VSITIPFLSIENAKVWQNGCTLGVKPQLAVHNQMFVKDEGSRLRQHTTQD